MQWHDFDETMAWNSWRTWGVLGVVCLVLFYWNFDEMYEYNGFMHWVWCNCVNLAFGNHMES